MTDTNIYAAGSSNMTLTSAGNISTLSAPNGTVNIGSDNAGTLTAGTLTADALTTNALITTADGKVGIGESDPKTSLDVRSDFAILPGFGWNTTLGQGLYFRVKDEAEDASRASWIQSINRSSSDEKFPLHIEASYAKFHSKIESTKWLYINSWIQGRGNEVGQGTGGTDNQNRPLDYHFKYSGNTQGFIYHSAHTKSNGEKEMNNFTGQHRCFVNDIDYNNYENYIGLIASANNNQYRQMSEGIYHKIMINEALPILSVSKSKNDKSVFGVISYKEDRRLDKIGNFGTPYDKETGDNRSYVNSVGEGCIWVISENGNIESGDYITSSSVPGYGMLQNDNHLYNFTVAKSTMDCNFTKSKVPKKKAKQIKITENIKEKITEKVTTQDEYVDYDKELNRYVKKYNTMETEEEKITTHDLYDDSGNIIGRHRGPEYIDVVSERYENETDQFGNLILIDDTDDNGNIIYEDYCETRYVDNNGKIISENEYNTKKSNGEIVYMACLVGCTYHCG